MLVKEVMTTGCTYCSSSDTLEQAARLMAQSDIGVVPVADNEKLIGMVTDRDIVVRGIAQGKQPQQTPVTDLMTDEVYYCFDDQTCDEAATSMSEMQVRRLPVVDRDKNLIGLVSLGDLASKGASAKAKKALTGVSKG